MLDYEPLPCPDLSIELSVPADRGETIDFLALPARPGVFAFEDEDGSTLALAITRNLRRLIRSKLESDPQSDGPSRRIDYRAITRRVRAMTVGSCFEAEWAYLQLARSRTPSTYASLLDRWRGWFVHIDPEVEFPRWTKTCRPFTSPPGAAGRYFGPMPDKHSTGRYIEMIEDAFDLCRYHHILIEAPDAKACVYKEMGRCPAPCDGTITMDEYRKTVRSAADFAAIPYPEWCAEVERKIKIASKRQDYEAAARWQMRRERTKLAGRAAYTLVKSIERFRFLGVFTSDREHYARIFLILGGWIEPMADIPLDANSEAIADLIESVHSQATNRPLPLTGNASENIGLVCRGLFRPKSERNDGEWLDLDETLDVTRLSDALHRLSRRGVNENAPVELEEQIMESLPE